MNNQRKSSRFIYVSIAAVLFSLLSFSAYIYAVGPGTNTVSPSPSTTLVNSTGNTLTFTYTSAGAMSGGSIAVTVPSTWSIPQGTSGVAGYTTASTNGTVGRVFDNADALLSWNHSTSAPQTACTGGLTLDTTFKHSGTGSIKCVNANDGTGGIWYNNIAAQDWSTYATIGFWIYTDTAITNSRLSFQYSANTNLTSSLETLSLGRDVPANAWTFISFSFGSTTRSIIQSYGFNIQNASVKSATVWTDDFAIGSGSTIIPGFSGRTFSVNAISLTTGQTITFTYGAGGGASGAVAPTVPELSAFSTASTADNATATSTIALSPTVNVIDTTVPAVALTVPASSATIHGSSATLTATATDNVAVSGVTFYYDSTHKIGSEITSTSSPSTYSSTLDTTALVDGSHTIFAVARDSSNNYATSSAKTITVDNTAPALSAIASSTVSTRATVTWTTNENSTSKVYYGTVSGTYTTSTSSASLVTSHSLTLTSLSPLTRYYFVVVSADASGNTSTSTEKSLATLDLDLTPPVLTSVGIASNNASTSLAKIGDTVALTFTANEMINAPVVTIDGHTVTATNTSGNTWTATYTLISGDSEGSVSFSVTATDISSNTASPVTVVTDSSSVTFDKTAPTNQNTVFPTSESASGGSTVSVVSSGSLYNTIWYAPVGTTNFVAGPTMTTAGGTATSISAPSADGAYRLFVIDASGNVSSASTAVLTVDNTAPTLTIVTIASNEASTTLAKVGSTVTLSIVSSENISTPVVTIGAESGGDVTVTQGMDASHWTASATMTSGDSEGMIPFTINFTDVPGNIGTEVTAITFSKNVTFDKTPPTLTSVSLSSNNASTTLAKVGNVVTLSFVSSECISTSTVAFRSGGNLVTNAVTVSKIATEAWTASYVVSSSDTEGAITFNISSYHDIVGNNGSSVTTGSGSVSIDKTAPTVTLSSSASTTTGTSPIPVTATFSERVTGFSVDGISVTNGMAQNIGGSGTTYTFDVVPSANGAVSISLMSGVAHDSVENDSVASAQLTRTFSSLRPTVSLTTTASSTTKLSPIPVTVTFSASVDGFDESDLAGHVTNATVSGFSGSGSLYTFNLIPTSEGTVSATIPAGSAVDTATGINQNFASPQLSVIYDATAPTLSEVSSVSSPTNDVTPSYTFNTSEAGTLIVSGGCTTNTAHVSAGNNTIIFSSLADGAYNCTITVIDAGQNISSVLHITSFSVHTAAPVITDISATTGTNSATIHWTTDELASSQVLYGLTSTYDSQSAEADIISRVASHSAVLTNLVSCATYHYTASSTDAAGNSGSDGDNTFTTKGCAGNASVKSQSAHSVSRATGGNASLISDGTGLSISVPSSYGSDDAQFQIKQLDQAAALDVTTGLGVPTSTQAIGDYVFDLHALTDVETSQSLFSAPLTITLHYKLSDITGFDESTLKIYRNDNNTWTELTNCSVNTSGKSVTCDTEHFSTFAIFGQTSTSSPSVPPADPIVNTTSTQSQGSSSGTRFGCKDPSALNYEYFSRSTPSLCKYAASKWSFVRDLMLGMAGADVLALQQFLNEQGFIVAASGPGSKGHETAQFGGLTKSAVIRYQKAKSVTPAIGYFGPKTRAAAGK